jgi:hypothetical protein
MPRVTPSPTGVAPATATGRGQPNDRRRSDEPPSQLPHCPGEDGRPHALVRAGTARTPCANGRAKPRATRSERAPLRPSADLRCHKRHGCACRGSRSGPCDQSESGRALVPGSALGRRAARLSSRCNCTRPLPVADVRGETRRQRDCAVAWSQRSRREPVAPHLRKHVGRSVQLESVSLVRAAIARPAAIAKRDDLSDQRVRLNVRFDEDHPSRTGGPPGLLTGLQSARARKVKHEQTTRIEGVMATRKHRAQCRGPAGARSDIAKHLADRNDCRARWGLARRREPRPRHPGGAHRLRTFG